MKDYNYFLDLVKEKKKLENKKRDIYQSIYVLDADDTLSRRAYINEIEIIDMRLSQIKNITK